MLAFDDSRWETLEGGYRKPVDLRSLLNQLEMATDPEPAWQELWNDLFHQGQVGEGSFVAVPHLVRIHAKRNVADWNTYALAATIELARGVDGNPEVPGWARASYDAALAELGRLGLKELPLAQDPETSRSVLALLAIVHGARTYGRLLVDYTEDEILELEQVSRTDPEAETG